MQKVELLIDQHGLDIDVVGLFSFIKQAIEGREYAKFHFTKVLSDVLSLIKQAGSRCDLSTDDLSYLDIRAILSNYSSSWNLDEEILNSIRDGKEKFAQNQNIILPPLITAVSDIYQFNMPESSPNYGKRPVNYGLMDIA